MNITTFSNYIGATIRLSFMCLLAYPSILAVTFLVLISEFSFTNFYTQFYGYVSEVSQKPAESPLHLNESFCKTSSYDDANRLGEMPPPVKCDEKELKSVLISEAAEYSSAITVRVYWFLVMFNFVFTIVFNASGGRYEKMSMAVDTFIRRIFSRRKSNEI